MTEYRLSPVDHATIDDTMDRLAEARRRAGLRRRSRAAVGAGARARPDDVLYAGDVLSRAIEGLSYLRTAHSDEDEEREKAAAIRASESAELDQWDAEDRDRGV